MVKQKIIKIAVFCIVVFIAIALMAVFVTTKSGVLAKTNSDGNKPLFDTDNLSSDSSEQLHDVPSKKKFDKKDIDKATQYIKRNEKRNLTPLQPQVHLSPTPFTPNLNYVQPILFIASDLSESPGNSAAITSTFQLLKRWYSGALEYNNSGYTYRVADTIVYHAPQPFSYYKCPNHETSCDNYDGIFGNIQIELMTAGYPIWSIGTSHIVFVKGAGGWAGSNCQPNCGANSPAPGPASEAGFTIFGDWALDAITGTVNSDCFANMGTACYLDPQRGAIGHELGHTFGLSHALDQDGSIMYSWWNFPFVSLFDIQGNDEKGLLRNSSIFFSSQACSKDTQINQVNIPDSVRTKSKFIASFNVTNYGFCHWETSNVDLHIVRDDVWRVKSQQLGQDIYPAQPYTFSLTLTAPAIKAPRTAYNNYWKMRSSNQYFGPRMGSAVTVLGK